MKERSYENYYIDYVEIRLSTREMGEIYGVDRKTVEYWLKKYGITRPDMYLNKYPVEYLVDLVANKGYLLKEVVEMLGDASYSGLTKFLHKHGYNFTNHPAQTKKHSEYMKTDANPTKGTVRPKYVWDATALAMRLKAQERWLKIDNYKSYATTARGLAYEQLKSDLTEGYEIDHIFSVKHCWENKIPVDLCSHISNLRIIPKSENKAKSYNSEVTHEQFWENIINSTTIESTLDKSGSE